MPTNVTLLLKGSLVLFAKEGRPTGSVRILKSPPPNHMLSLSYKKQPPGGVFGPATAVTTIQDNLNLQVINPLNPNITLRDPGAQIDRKQTPTHTESTKWFVDLENDLYSASIGFKPGGFKQVLTFNSGELFTDSVNKPDNPSYNFLLIQRGSDANYEDFGFVAIRIGIAFSTNSNVVFTNGGTLVFDSNQDAPGTNYEIDLINDASSHPRLCTDANHYYKGVGSGISPDEKILFASVQDDEELKSMLAAATLRGDHARVTELKKVNLGAPAGPEAACFPAFMSRTDP